MMRAVAMAVVFSTGCLGVPSLDNTVLLTCEVDTDCPAELLCAPGINRCVEELDITPPVLSGVLATSPQTVELSFDEALDAAATPDVMLYDVVPALGITDVQLSSDGQRVTLVTDVQSPEVSYRVDVASATDIFLNRSGPLTGMFVGFGLLPDDTPPILLVPDDEERLTTTDARLVWTPRRGNSTYSVDIATDASFTAMVTGSPFVTTEPFLTTPLPAGRTYYWRVSGSDTAVSEVRSFGLVIDDVYVYCPPGEDCTNPTTGRRLGTQDDPYYSVVRGVRVARDLGATTLHIASRGSPYPEALTLLGGGHDILAGYAGDFSTRDPINNKTELAPATIPLTLNNVDVDMVVSGLDLTSTSTSIVSVDAPNRSITMEDCIFRGNSMLAEGVNIEFTDVTLRRVSLESPTSNDTTGLSSRGALTLEDVTINLTAGASPYDATAVFWSAESAGQALTITRSTINVEGGPNAVDIKAFILNSGSSQPPMDFSMSQSVVTVGDASNRSQGIRVQCAAPVCESLTIEDSFIEVGDVTSTALRASTVIDTFSLESLVMERNRIRGLIDLRTDAVPIRVVNNVILNPAGDGSKNALEINGAQVGRGAVMIAHNIFGFDGSQDSNALVLSDATPILVNNVFWGVIPATSPAECVWVTTLEAVPETAFNNAFLGCGTRLWNHAGPIRNDEVEVNSMNGSEVNDGICTLGVDCETSQFANNFEIGLTPSQLFVDWDGPDNDPWTLADNDYTPTMAGAIELSGGVDTTGMTCGTVETPASCGSVMLDLEGATRPATPTVGAVEP